MSVAVTMLTRFVARKPVATIAGVSRPARDGVCIGQQHPSRHVADDPAQSSTPVG